MFVLFVCQPKKYIARMHEKIYIRKKTKETIAAKISSLHTKRFCVYEENNSCYIDWDEIKCGFVSTFSLVGDQFGKCCAQ